MCPRKSSELKGESPQDAHHVPNLIDFDLNDMHFAGFDEDEAWYARPRAKNPSRDVSNDAHRPPRIRGSDCAPSVRSPRPFTDVRHPSRPNRAGRCTPRGRSRARSRAWTRTKTSPTTRWTPACSSSPEPRGPRRRTRASPGARARRARAARDRSPPLPLENRAFVSFPSDAESSFSIRFRIASRRPFFRHR